MIDLENLETRRQEAYDYYLTTGDVSKMIAVSDVTPTKKCTYCNHTYYEDELASNSSCYECYSNDLEIKRNDEAENKSYGY